MAREQILYGIFYLPLYYLTLGTRNWKSNSVLKVIRNKTANLKKKGNLFQASFITHYKPFLPPKLYQTIPVSLPKLTTILPPASLPVQRYMPDWIICWLHSLDHQYCQIVWQEDNYLSEYCFTWPENWS